MNRFGPKREHFTPKGAVKVSDKLSDAVVYVYTSSTGRPGAVGFHGSAQRPDFHHTYLSPAKREEHVKRFFAGRAASLALRKETAAKRAQPHKLEVGHILVASWGYDQTNVDWFEVVKIVGRFMVEVRPIGAVIDDTAPLAGRCYPRAGEFKGPATRHRVSWGDNVRINESVHAHLWDGRPRHWSAYH